MHALHPVVSTPSRLLSLLRCATHPLWLPSMGYREAYRVPTPYAIALYGLHAVPLQHYSVGCITGTLLRACHVERVCVYHSMHTERAHAERAYGYYVVATDTLRDATPYGVLPHTLLPDYAMAGVLQRVDS